MGCDASDGRETEVGNAGSPVLVNQDVRLRRWIGCKRGVISFRNKETYSFQIPVDRAEIVHVLQTIRNAGQLNGTSVQLLRDKVTTYELGAVYVPILLNEFVDISVLHPLGNQSKTVFV